MNTNIEPIHPINQPQPTWRALLHHRRISDAVIDLFEIKPSEGGWSYPVPNGANSRRWKNYSSNGGKKYAWRPGKPPGALYYHAPTIKDAIAVAEGTVWLAGGEPNVWALASAGIQHSLCWLNGETAVPSSLAEDLQTLKVREVHYAYDADEAGLKSALLVRERLYGSGIQWVIHDLPTSLGYKADVGTAWQQYDGLLPFEEWLLQLPEHIFPVPVATPNSQERRLPLVTRSHDGWEPPEGLIPAIEEALEITRYKSNGWSKLVCCPFHDDTKPSANWHREKHVLHCFTCGTTFLAKEVVEKLGLNWDSFYPADPVPPPKAEKATRPSAQELRGLSTTLRSALLQRNNPGAARLLDALYAAGWKPGHIFTAPEAVTVGRKAGISRKVVAAALKSEVSYYAPTLQRQDKNFVPLFHPIDDYKDIGGGKGGKNRRGRPPQYYRLPSPAELTRYLGVTTYEHDVVTMPPKALRRVKLYRANVLHAFVEANTGWHSRAKLGAIIGLDRTNKEYDRLAQLYVTPYFWRVPLGENSFKGYTNDRKDRPWNEWIEDADGKKYPPTREGFKRAQLVSGERPILRVVQRANFYAVTPPDQGLKIWISMIGPPFTNPRKLH